MKNFRIVNQIPFQFSNLLIILLTFQLGIGIYGSIRQDQANDVWDRIFDETLNKHEIHKETWDFMQWGVSILNETFTKRMNYYLYGVLSYFLVGMLRWSWTRRLDQ